MFGSKHAEKQIGTAFFDWQLPVDGRATVERGFPPALKERRGLQGGIPVHLLGRSRAKSE